MCECEVSCEKTQAFRVFYVLVSDHTPSCFVLIRITRYALISVPVRGTDWGSGVKCWLLGREKTHAFRVSYLGSYILLFRPHMNHQISVDIHALCAAQTEAQGGQGTDWGSGSQMLTPGPQSWHVSLSMTFSFQFTKGTLNPIRLLLCK